VSDLEAVAQMAGAVLNAVGIACFFLGTARRSEDLGQAMHLLYAAGMGLWSAAWLMAGDWGLAALYGVIAVANAWSWWYGRRKRRKRRKRSVRAMGAKSLALLAELCRKARESARPRPMLRPVPGGAR
jgi:O-antigen/teichoic acid export membrane protein